MSTDELLGQTDHTELFTSRMKKMGHITFRSRALQLLSKKITMLINE